MQRRVTVFTRAAGWLGLPRLYSAMHQHGFAVDLICAKGAFAQNSAHLDRVVGLGTQESDQVWIEGLLDFESEHLLLGDDDAVDWLIRTCSHSSELKTFLQARGYDIANMALARNKYALAQRAVELGIPVPPLRQLTAGSPAQALVTQLGLPLVLKSAFGFAGNEVFICSDADEIRQVQDHLQQARGGFAQRYVEGMALMVPTVCRNGRVLARFAAAKRSTWPPVTGPSTIVEIADHPVAGAYVDTLVAALGLSGFISVDFVLDSHQQYWLMECNLRPVPVSHYKGVLVDAWLHSHARTLPAGSDGLLALYPQSLIYPVDLPLFKVALLDDQMTDQRLLQAYQQQIAAENARHAESQKLAAAAPGPQSTDDQRPR